MKSHFSKLELLTIWDGLNKLPDTAIVREGNQTVTVSDLKIKVANMA